MPPAGVKFMSFFIDHPVLVENDGGRGTDKSLVVIELNYFGAFTALLKFRRH